MPRFIVNYMMPGETVYESVEASDLDVARKGVKDRLETAGDTWIEIGVGTHGENSRAALNPANVLYFFVKTPSESRATEYGD